MPNSVKKLWKMHQSFNKFMGGHASKMSTFQILVKRLIGRYQWRSINYQSLIDIDISIDFRSSIFIDWSCRVWAIGLDQGFIFSTIQEKNLRFDLWIVNTEVVRGFFITADLQTGFSLFRIADSYYNICLHIYYFYNILEFIIIIMYYQSFAHSAWKLFTQ